MLRLVSIAALSVCLSLLPAQSAQRVGSVYPQLANTCGDGTPVLDVAVHYPATPSYAVQPRAGGWPVIVFLHGFNLLGYDYHDLGLSLAANGFIVVMANTSRFDYLELAKDARSMPDALAAWNTTPGHLLTGALDTNHIGLMGHSMGGGVAGMSLARSDQYRCGLALAPVFPGAAVASLVRVPFGIVVGAGDMATPWATQSTPFFQTLGTEEGLRFNYLMSDQTDHLNVAGLWSTHRSPSCVRTVAIAAGWFHHFLEGAPSGLEQCLGAATDQDPLLVKLETKVVVPQTWSSGPLQIGRSVRLSVAAEDGLGGVLAAAFAVNGLPTIFGTLYLDPGSAFALGVRPVSAAPRIDITLQVPNDPNLIGLQVPMQGLGTTTVEPVFLGSPLQLTVLQ